MSKIEVNTVEPQCGTTLTLGASGDTVTLGAGASQSGFGRTGTVDWQTGSIKTSTFTAANGEGYFANTSGGEFTMNLPAGTAGAIVAVADYTRTFATNRLTVTPNGSEKIGGVAASIFLNVNGQALTLVYVDATEGWINVQNAEDTEEGIVPAFITATGGTITTVCTNYKVHTFTGPGTFTVCSTGNPAGSDSVDYLVIAGGASGGGEQPNSYGSGGGGAGGYRESSGTASGSYTASPLGACVSALPVTAQGYPITVGGGGAARTAPTTSIGNAGSNSVFSTITSTGGGGGGTGPGGGTAGANGGSGGGAAGSLGTPFRGTGNTPPVSPPQGNPGGAGQNTPYVAGGGGRNPFRIALRSGSRTFDAAFFAENHLRRRSPASGYLSAKDFTSTGKTDTIQGTGSAPSISLE